MVTADRRVPALILKVGQYPPHSGSVAVVRTLGRLGIPVYAITEDRLTPAAVSRYCTGRFVWRATGLEDPAFLAAARGRAAIGPRSRG
jgi:D-aspartate ligase